MAADKRARVWSFIGYPEDSLPENYAAVLSDELHLCWAESPVHDADLNGDGGEENQDLDPVGLQVSCDAQQQLLCYFRLVRLLFLCQMSSRSESSRRHCLILLKSINTQFVL